jgi:hypothetical protein
VAFDPADVSPWFDEAKEFVDELSKEAENRMKRED